LTGARKGEILTLKWDMIDWRSSVALLPISKTGRKAIYLSEPAVDILRAIPRSPDNPYVFVGLKRGDHLKELKKAWEWVR
jgi:integrase